MLIKINNIQKEFENEIEKLKSRFDVGTASGAATQAIYRFIELESNYEDSLCEVSRLETELSNIKRLILEKNNIATRLIDICEI